MKWMTMALTVAGAAVAATPLRAQRASSGCRDCDTLRAPTPRAAAQATAIFESSRAELERAQRDLERAIQAIREHGELLQDTSRAAREEMAKMKRDLLDAQRRANFEMTRLMREDLPRIMARTEARAPMAMRMDQEPPGWMGVYFSGAPDEVTVVNGQKTVRYRAYPVIVSVEPGSPAERAGIAAGDHLLSLGGIDMTTGSVSLERLLQPGRALPVRVRRAGDVKTVVVNVGRRPDDFVFMVAPQVPGSPPPPPTPDMPRGGTIRLLPRGALPPMAAPMPPMPPMSLMGPMGLAGAELTPMQPELAEYFGTDHGLLVVRLGSGTSAERAGLRAGDVILTADGIDIRSIRIFQGVLERADDRSVKIEYLRKHEKKTTTLSW